MDTFDQKSRSLKGFFSYSIALIGSIGFLQAQSNETTFFKDVTQTHMPIDSDTHALDVVLLDVDTDGDLDLILALESEPNRLYLNDGQGKFTWKKGAFTEASHDSEHVRIADFNKDGIADLIFVAEDDQNHEYYLGQADGSFRDVSNRLPSKSEGNGLDVGDVNGDGLVDIVVGNSGAEAQNFLWINDPDRLGYFIDRTKTHLPAVEDQTQSVKLADLNGDGALDLVVGNEVPPNYMYFNDGDGKFTDKSDQLQQLVPLHTREVLVFDADGDGDQDIVFANLTSNGGPFEKDPQTRLLSNDGKGVFTDVSAVQMPKNVFSTYAAIPFDYDRDGHLDLLLSAMEIPPFKAMQVQAYHNDGKGNFSATTDSVIPAITVGRSWGLTTGDVNGDGLEDVIIGAWGDQVRILLAK